MLCCISGSDWRDVEVAFTRLVSMKREAVTGDSQKGIHNSSICFVYKQGLVDEIVDQDCKIARFLNMVHASCSCN